MFFRRRPRDGGPRPGSGSDARPAHLVEALDRRLLLDALPAPQPMGEPFPLHSFTTGRRENVAVAADADGDFVAAWEIPAGPSGSKQIVARRFDNTGAPLGPEFGVGASIPSLSDIRNPDVAMDAAGNFVIVWESYQSSIPSVRVRCQSPGGFSRNPLSSEADCPTLLRRARAGDERT